MARVTGVGGVFLRARDPKALAVWYAEHLGMTPSEYGGVNFEWTDEVPEGTGTTAWSTFPADTAYFGPGTERCATGGDGELPGGRSGRAAREA